MNQKPSKETFSTSSAAAKFAVQNAGDGKGTLPTLVGYAIVWNATSGDRGGYVARMAPGSAVFAPEVQAYYAHDSAEIIGTTANGTLRIMPDDYGVKVEIDPPDTTTGRDVVALVTPAAGRGAYVRGMSFGMIPEEWEDTEEDGQTVRTFTKFTVDEVTITGIPAMAETSIGPKYTADIAGDELKLEQLRWDFLSL